MQLSCGAKASECICTISMAGECAPPSAIYGESWIAVGSNILHTIIDRFAVTLHVLSVVCLCDRCSLLDACTSALHPWFRLQLFSCWFIFRCRLALSKRLLYNFMYSSRSCPIQYAIRLRFSLPKASKQPIAVCFVIFSPSQTLAPKQLLMRAPKFVSHQSSATPKKPQSCGYKFVNAICKKRNVLLLFLSKFFKMAEMQIIPSSFLV